MPTNAVAVMVLILIENEVVMKVSRVYKNAKDAMKYEAELNDAIAKGTRKDILKVWRQDNVRLY